MKSLFLSLFVILCNTVQAIGCDCESIGPFKKAMADADFVALVRIENYIAFRTVNDGKFPISMSIKVIDVYKGTRKFDTIIVWGDNGALCRPYILNFKKDENYIIAFYRVNNAPDYPQEKDSDFYISDCGTFYLNVNKGKSKANGDIDGKLKSITIKKLRTMMAKKSRQMTMVFIPKNNYCV